LASACYLFNAQFLPACSMNRVGRNHTYTVYIRCFSRDITKYTVINGAYIRFWPSLGMNGGKTDSRKQITVLILARSFSQIYQTTARQPHPFFVALACTSQGSAISTHPHKYRVGKNYKCIAVYKDTVYIR